MRTEKFCIRCGAEVKRRGMARAKYCSSTCCQANAMEAFERRGGRRGVRKLISNGERDEKHRQADQ